MDYLSDVESLEAAVGSRQLPPLLKSIDFIDAHCALLIERSPVAVLGYTERGGELRAAAVGGHLGFAGATERKRLRLPVPDDARPGAPVSTMFLIPGWREALRINGRLDADDAEVLVVEEAFVHCGKAILRSELWTRAGTSVDASEGGRTPLDAAVRAFLAASPFVVQCTVDASGAADASPKGDPPGFAQVLDDARLAIPDRPGNRRTDTFHNLVEDPRIALVALVPGDERVLEIRGTARVTDDAELRATMAVRGKPPQAALVVDVTSCTLSPSPALVESRLWDPAVRRDVSDLPSAGQIWTDHIRANGTPGLKAAAIRAAANGKLVQAGTEVEYKRKLY